MGNIIHDIRRIVSSAGGGSPSATTLAQRFKTTLTAAQVKTIFSAPVSLISAAGANKIISIDPFSIMVKLSSGANFNFNNGDFIQIGYRTGTVFGSVSAPIFNGVSLATASPLFAFSTGFSVEGGNLTMATTANEPIEIFASIANATTGGRTLTITFNYSILDVS